jgi:hypothetical protein
MVNRELGEMICPISFAAGVEYYTTCRLSMCPLYNEEKQGRFKCDLVDVISFYGRRQ